MFQRVQNFDVMVLDFILKFVHKPLLDRIMPAITWLGNMGLVWIAISVILLINKRHRKTEIMVLASMIIAAIFGEGMIKPLVQRPRPFVDITVYKLLISEPLTYSFPSGHTASSFAAAGILWREFRKYRVYIIAGASLIAFSRLYLYVHYPCDIIGGIALGLFCSWIVLVLGKNIPVLKE
jgi:undecaprenyl-diphosphatase